MMLAEGGEINVPHDYHIMLIFLEDGAIDEAAQILFITLCEEEHGFRIALWGFKQTLSVGVFAHALEQRPDGRAHLVEPSRSLLCALFEPFARSAAWGHTVSNPETVVGRSIGD